MAATSLHGQILDAYVSTLQGLATLKPLNSRVYKRMSFEGTFALTVDLPCIVVFPVGIESWQVATNEQDDSSLPITVRVIDHIENDPDNLDSYLYWREIIRLAFNQKRLSGVTPVMKSEIQPSPSIEPEALPYQKLSMPLLFSVVARDERT